MPRGIEHEPKKIYNRETMKMEDNPWFIIVHPLFCILCEKGVTHSGIECSK